MEFWLLLIAVGLFVRLKKPARFKVVDHVLNDLHGKNVMKLCESRLFLAENQTNEIELHDFNMQSIPIKIR